MHDRIIGAFELCCRRGEMLLIENKGVYWDMHQIGIRGHTTKDKENRRIPFDPEGRLRAILQRRAKLGPQAFVFGTEAGEYQANIRTAWDTLRLLASGYTCPYQKLRRPRREPSKLVSKVSDPCDSRGRKGKLSSPQAPEVHNGRTTGEYRPGPAASKAMVRRRAVRSGDAGRRRGGLE